MELRERFLRSRGVRPCGHRAPCRPGTHGESVDGERGTAFACVCAVHLRLCVCAQVCVCPCALCVSVFCGHTQVAHLFTAYTCAMCICAVHTCSLHSPVPCAHTCSTHLFTALTPHLWGPCLCRAHSSITPSDQVRLSPGPRCKEEEEEEEEAESCHPSQPCLHGGSCVHGSCHCPPGYSGARCQHREGTAQGHGGSSWEHLGHREHADTLLAQ